MGPTEESLSIADAIIAAHGLQVGRYQLAYTIMAWVEEQDAIDAARDGEGVGR